MPCYKPIKAFLPFTYDSDGKRKLSFSQQYIDDLVRNSNLSKKLLPNGEKSYLYYTKSLILPSDFSTTGDVLGCLVDVPCGKCLGCRLSYARRWSARAYLEGKFTGFANCCFVTLTFNDDMLYKRNNPKSLNKLEFSQFFKRFRERVRCEYGVTNLRFFSCGEYGSKKGRPHYHFLLYGFNFPDKKEINYKNFPHVDHKLYPKILKNGQLCRYYISDFLTKCWSPAGSDMSFGFHTISDLNYETCAYTARYIMKKCNKEESNFLGREQEFNLVSRMPGLGYDYFIDNYENMIRIGYINLGDGRVSDIPRYFVDKLEEFNPELYNRYKLDKQKQILYNLIDKDKADILSNSLRDVKSERLQALQELQKQKLDKFVRTYEIDSVLHNI